MDDEIASFTSITGCSDANQARQYLQVTDGNLEQAITLFFESGGIDLESRERSSHAHQSYTAPRPSGTSQNTSQGQARDKEIISIDSDDEEFADIDDDEPITVPPRTSSTQQSNHPSNPEASTGEPTLESDEAVARRLQEEFYGNAGRQSPERDADGVRAPIGRTTETLIGPDSNWGDSGGMDLSEAIEQQIAARRNRGRPGIFNQQPASSSQWDASLSRRRAELSRVTGGASETSSKATTLAEMYRPPFELMTRVPFDQARQQGRGLEKWLLVNVQDSAIFDCQILNRDIWKHPGIAETVRENFVFLQYDKADPSGTHYNQYYFPEHDSQEAYPHISIIDPRTGELVKRWSGPPVPKAADFLQELHDFLDQYSLKANSRNPITPSLAVKKEKEPVSNDPVNTDAMTEEEQLELAMRNSIATAGQNGSDNGTAIPPPSAKGKGKATEEDDAHLPTPTANEQQRASRGPSLEPSVELPSSFSLIPSNSPHTEPAPGAGVTRIQFRHSGGRVIRRFSTNDPVRRIYEWMKADPLEEDKRGAEFELVCSGHNLLAEAETPIGEVPGLGNGTVMVEFL